ncbi:MAG: hypothetical protein LBC74_06380, partial [Planctomycetaceae bacterium]|nr:hypothetical protein [Planctomycetaceae bacterium]
MNKKLIDFVVDQVCFRNRMQKIFDSVVNSVCCANILAIVFLCVCFCVGKPISLPLIFVTIINLAAVLSGIVFASFDAKQTIQAAIQIDQYYNLKDRVLTAVQICRHNKITPMMEIQLEDTAKHIAKITPSNVVRYRLLFSIVLMLLFMLAAYCCGLILGNNSGNLIDMKSVQNPVSDLDKSNDIVQKIVDDIRNNNNVNLSAQNQNERLDGFNSVREQLRNKIERVIQRLTNASTTQDSVSALSEIEQSIRNAATELDVQAYNFSFQAMAAAFDNAAILRDTATAIKKGDYGKAATAIESIKNEDFNTMTQLERRSVNAELHDAVDKMRLRNQDELEKLTSKLADEIAHS